MRPSKFVDFLFYGVNLLGVLSIGSSLALGREGPSIQIGGVVSQGVNAFLKGNRTQENILISTDAASDLAAAFTASVTAKFITSYLLGIDPTIQLAPLVIFPLRHYFLLVVLGIFIAICGLFIRK